MLRFAYLWSVFLSMPTVAQPPRLVVFVSVDALGSELWLRHAPAFTKGFHTLQTQGAYFPIATYDIAETVTGVGHATLATGAWPNRHGIVGNKVFNRSTNALEAVFADGAVNRLGTDASAQPSSTPAKPEDLSPRNLLAETLSDVVVRSRHGKSISISGKARAAIALGGHLGKAFWYDEKTGEFTSSSFYGAVLPAWIQKLNGEGLSAKTAASPWALSRKPETYFGLDEKPGESDWYGLKTIFPHPLNGSMPNRFSALSVAPAMNDVLIEAAQRALQAEALGQDETPDLLSLSLSPLDRTFHLYGPSSWEIQDHLLRLDASLGRLIALAEKAAGGKQHLLVVLSADHGGADIPEAWAALGLPASRVRPTEVLEKLNQFLNAKFHAEKLAAAMEEIDVYLDIKKISEKKLDLKMVRHEAAEFLKTQDSFQMASSQDELGDVADETLQHILKHSFHRVGSGDVLVVPKAFSVITDEPQGTAHGSPWSYDANVPVFFYGAGLQSGTHLNHIQPIDLAPTISAMLEMAPPAMSEGRVLTEIFAR
jgi:predicted AlkP superfamily pyrophosphatase or phosphodiesterase